MSFSARKIAKIMAEIKGPEPGPHSGTISATDAFMMNYYTPGGWSNLRSGGTNVTETTNPQMVLGITAQLNYDRRDTHYRFNIPDAPPETEYSCRFDWSNTATASPPTLELCHMPRGATPVCVDYIILPNFPNFITVNANTVKTSTLPQPVTAVNGVIDIYALFGNWRTNNFPGSGNAGWNFPDLPHLTLTYEDLNAGGGGNVLFGGFPI